MFKPFVTLSVAGLFLVLVISVVIGAVTFFVGSVFGMVYYEEALWKSIGRESSE